MQTLFNPNPTESHTAVGNVKMGLSLNMSSIQGLYTYGITACAVSQAWLGMGEHGIGVRGGLIPGRRDHPFLGCRIQMRKWKYFSLIFITEKGKNIHPWMPHTDRYSLLLSFLQEDAMLINEIKDDLQAECSKYGEVKKVMIFDVSIKSSCLLCLWFPIYPHSIIPTDQTPVLSSQLLVAASGRFSNNYL